MRKPLTLRCYRHAWGRILQDTIQVFLHVKDHVPYRVRVAAVRFVRNLHQDEEEKEPNLHRLASLPVPALATFALFADLWIHLLWLN